MNTITPEDRDAPRELVGIIAPGDWRQAREALDAFPDQPWAPEFVRSLLDALDQAEAERDQARAQADRVRELLTKWVTEYSDPVYRGNGWTEGVRDAAREALKELDGDQ